MDPVVVGSSPISHPADERESGRRVVFERGGDVEIGVVLGGGERHLRIGDARGARKVPRRQAWIFLPVDIDEESLRARADSLAAAVAPRPLWETLRAANDAQGEARGWDLSAIVAAWAGARGETIADESEESYAAQVALLRTLLQNPGYFHRVGGGFAPATADELAGVLRSLSERARRVRVESDLLRALQAGEIPDPIRRDFERMLFAPDKGDFAFRALAAHLGGRDPLLFARFFLRVGILSSPREYWRRMFLLDWPPPPDEDGEGIVAADCADWPAGAQNAFSIDDEDTVEIDDAFSVSPTEAGFFEIGIHIAAPALFLRPASPIDLAARRATTTAYFPDEKFMMLPRAIVERASLRAGCARPAASLYLRARAADGAIVGARDALDVVRIAANCSPAQCDAGEMPPALRADFAALVQAAARLPAPGAEFEAVAKAAPRDFKIVVDADERIKIRARRRGAADTLVESLMRVVNARWGRALAAAKTGIFRSDSRSEPFSPKLAARFGRKQNDCYAWTTSPLRRYADLHNQRLLFALWRGDKPDSRFGEAATIARETDRMREIAQRHQRHGERFWALRALSRLPPATRFAAERAPAGRCRLRDYPLAGAVDRVPSGGGVFWVEAETIDPLSLAARFRRVDAPAACSAQ